MAPIRSTSPGNENNLGKNMNEPDFSVKTEICSTNKVDHTGTDFADELSVLEYLRLKLKRENWHREILPDGTIRADNADDPESQPDESGGLSFTSESFVERLAAFVTSWVDDVAAIDIPVTRITVLLAGLFALIAQFFLEPQFVGQFRSTTLPIVIYTVGALLIGYGAVIARRVDSATAEADLKNVLSDEVKSDAGSDIETAPDALADDCHDEDGDIPQQTVMTGTMTLMKITIAFGLTVVTFILFGNNQFNFINLAFWALATVYSVLVLVELPDGAKIRAWLRARLEGLLPIRLTISPWTILWVGVFALSGYFHFYQLAAVPTDMFSDHAEKLYDVMDILDGQAPIFFIRNTGREAFQFYWTTWMMDLFGTGISFLSLKIGTAMACMFALPFVYLLGKRVGGKWVGLLAMLFCGVAYWPNVLGRVALRFAFYPMFVAPSLYFLIRGLDAIDGIGDSSDSPLLFGMTRQSILSMILAGLFLGVGLQGYSAMRIVPLLFGLLFVVKWFGVPRGQRRTVFKLFLMCAWFAILGALPLLNIMVTRPDWVWYRSMSRLTVGGMNDVLGLLTIFGNNLRKALVMPFWNNGQIWVHSIPFRPAFEWVTAAFYFVGLCLAVTDVWRKRDFARLAMLISIPMLLLPSVLSLAFPDENPSLNRTGAAMIPMTVLAAEGFIRFMRASLRTVRGRSLMTLAVAGIGVLLLVGMARTNYDLVFTTYQNNYTRNAWNTKQIGEIFAGFDASIGDEQNAYVVPYPHWVDTRLVGITAGFPGRDFALARDLIPTLERGDEPMLFAVHVDDTETSLALQEEFPDGKLKLVEGTAPGKDFFLFSVP